VVVGAKVDAARGVAVICASIDNLVKGAAGQAVQNANLMFGLAEAAGLDGLVSQAP
jgi:N-acetyl-gamma-glutamyl-phosphate reductase